MSKDQISFEKDIEEAEDATEILKFGRKFGSVHKSKELFCRGNFLRVNT